MVGGRGIGNVVLLRSSACVAEYDCRSWLERRRLVDNLRGFDLETVSYQADLGWVHLGIWGALIVRNLDEGVDEISSASPLTQPAWDVSRATGPWKVWMLTLSWKVPKASGTRKLAISPGSRIEGSLYSVPAPVKSSSKISIRTPVAFAKMQSRVRLHAWRSH